MPQMAFNNQAASSPRLFYLLGLGDKTQFKAGFLQVTGMGVNTSRVRWSPAPAEQGLFRCQWRDGAQFSPTNIYLPSTGPQEARGHKALLGRNCL